MIDIENILIKLKHDPEVLWEIIDAYNNKLTRYIQRLSDIDISEVENLLQEVFIRVYTHINEYDSRYSFNSWIYRITHNIVIDNYRKNKKQENWIDNIISIDDEDYKKIIDNLSDWNNLENNFQKKELKNCIQKSISILPNNYKEIIILKYIENYNYEEISDILTIPIWTASTLVNRAREQLKKNIIKMHCNQ